MGFHVGYKNTRYINVGKALRILSGKCSETDGSCQFG